MPGTSMEHLTPYLNPNLWLLSSVELSDYSTPLSVTKLMVWALETLKRKDFW